MIEVKLELSLGIEGESLFATEEDYQTFRSRFCEAVASDLARFAKARTMSERESRERWIDG